MNKLVFLGTGNAANLERQLTSLYFHIDGKDFLIDCGDGMGTVRYFLKAGGKFETLNDIFITHRHADHVIGLGHLIFLKLLDENAHLKVYGPEESMKVIESFTVATHDHVRENLEHVEFIPMYSQSKVKLDNQLSVTCAEVHGPSRYAIACFSYAVEIGNKKIVFTGDMQPSPNFDVLAKGAEIMMHECFGLDKLSLQIHAAGHSSAKDAGVAAANAHAKHLILTHLGMKKDIGNGEKYIKEAAKYFKGKITIAEDLMEISSE